MSKLILSNNSDMTDIEVISLNKKLKCKHRGTITCTGGDEFAICSECSEPVFFISTLQKEGLISKKESGISALRFSDVKKAVHTTEYFTEDDVIKAVLETIKDLLKGE